jgi:hypothetical protein
MLDHLTRLARRIRCSAKTTLDGLVDELRRLWESHRQLLNHNAAYAGAAAAGASVIVTQDGLVDLLAALVASLLAIYAATRRSVVRR